MGACGLSSVMFLALRLALYSAILLGPFPGGVTGSHPGRTRDANALSSATGRPLTELASFNNMVASITTVRADVIQTIIN